VHKSQIFFWLLVSFLFGIFTASIFNVGQTFVYIGLIAALGLLAIFGYQGSFNKSALLTGFLLVAFLFGVIRFNSVNFSQNTLDVFVDLKAGQKNIEVVINGYVDSEPLDKSSRQEFVLRTKEVVAGRKVVEVSDRILITTNNFPKLYYGDKFFVRGALKRPQNLTDFDYITYLKKEGINMTMFYPDIERNTESNLGLEDRLKIKIYSSIFELKRSFELAIEGSVSEPNASFVNGILLGSRQNIPDDLKEAFKKTGTTHILAISGYNIMIISWVVLEVLVYFFRRRTAFWLSVIVVVLFTILTGASASVVRAAIMGLLILFANGYGRLYNPKNSIILAGAAMVWLNPLSLVFDVGFQLSFAAVLGLIYLYPKLDEKLKKVPKLGMVKETILMTISAQVAVAPLLIYYFKNFSLVSLPANVLVLPFLPIAMLFGFATGLGGMIFLPLGQIIGWFSWAVTTYQLSIVKLLGLF